MYSYYVPGDRVYIAFTKICHFMQCTHHYITLHHNSDYEFSVSDYFPRGKQIQKVGAKCSLGFMQRTISHLKFWGLG